jgi:hypothetical protein
VLVLVGAWLTAVATAPAASATPVAAPAAGAAPPISVTFHHTGAVQTWTVPAGVFRASFDVYGAQGGGNDIFGVPVIAGGKGGRAIAKIRVTPGEVIYIFVGGKGHDGGTTRGAPPPEHSRGGFNGGGNGGFSPENHNLASGGGGGGGASDIRVGGTHVANRVIVAGGGGGSSEKLYVPCGVSHGGGGGGLNGGSGVAADDGCIGGTGGDQLAGGGGCPRCGPSGSGILGFGGRGERPPARNPGGGGGGGGYYGGGGGPLGGGGGGGSGFGPRDTTFTTGQHPGDGLVVVTGGDDPPQLTLVTHADNGHAGGTATDRSWVLQAAGPTSIAGRTRDPAITQAQVEPGTYRLSEGFGPAGYSASNWFCRGTTIAGDVITLHDGDRVRCDITNTAIAPTITLVKHVSVGDTGAHKTPQDWTLSAEGPRLVSGRSGSPEVTGVPVAAGTYTLRETGPRGYTASAWHCVGGVVTGQQLVLAVGDRATCTITNTAVAPRLTLVKQVDNGAGGTAGPGAWTLRAAGPVTISGQTGSAAVTDAIVKVGTYFLSESGGPVGYTPHGFLCHGGSQLGPVVAVTEGERVTCTITNTYEKATPTLTTREAGGGRVGGVLSDEATLSGGREHTGTITFRLYGPNDNNCAGPVVETSEAAVTPQLDRYRSHLTHPITRAGVYRYVASYSGDRKNHPVAGACNKPGESTTVAPQTPQITTIPTGGVAGGTVHDTANLTGHPHVPITGEVRFTLYGPGDDTCTTPLQIRTDAVLNGSASTRPVAVTAAGTYRWIATYTGDANNAAVTSACAEEPVTVGKATPSISTTASGNVDAGAEVLDAATLAGGYQPTGSLAFVLYGVDDPTCNGTPAAVRTASVSDGSATSGGVQVTRAGTYHWVATYHGDKNNTGAESSCADEPVTVRPGPLARLVLTPASVTVHVGLRQAYTVTGYDAYGNPIGDVTGQTTFTIDGGGSCHVNSCTGPVGSHTVTGTAQSASGTATLLISAANQAPAITSAATATFLAGRAGSFKLSATGFPTPSLTASGRLPAGIRFHEGGNGTATLSGTPAPGAGGAYPLTVTARNGVSPNATQRFVLIVQTRATVLISGLRATPLRRGCVTETGTGEHDAIALIASAITGVIADATCRHFRLTAQGTIKSNGKLSAAAGGAVQMKVSVKLPRGPAARSASGSVSHGRWRISRVLPGVNLDPVPPTYVITVHYKGDTTTRQATTTRRIRIESERSGLN